MFSKCTVLILYFVVTCYCTLTLSTLLGIGVMLKPCPVFFLVYCRQHNNMFSEVSLASVTLFTG